MSSTAIDTSIPNHHNSDPSAPTTNKEDIMSDTATNHSPADNTTQKPTLDDNDHTTTEPNNEPPLSPLNPNSPPSSPTAAADVGAPQSTDPPLPSADEEQHSTNNSNNGNEQPSIQKVENDEQQQQPTTTTTNTNDNESTIATTTTTEATTTVAEATTSSNNNNDQQEEKKLVANKEETEAEAEQQQQDTNTSSSSNATPRDVLTRSVRFSEVITVRQETIVTESSVLGTIRDTIGKKVNKRRNSLKQASSSSPSSPSSSSSSQQQPSSSSSPRQSTTTDDESSSSNNSSSHQPHSVTTVTVVEETETNPELSEANQQQQQQQQSSTAAATTTTTPTTTEQQTPQETPTSTSTTVAATAPTNEVNSTETTETTETIVNEKTENADLYMGRKQRSTASFRYRKTSGHYRFNENSPIIQNLFKQNNDQILLFNAEVVQVNSKMKQHKRILIVSEKFLYTLNVRNYKLKRMVSLDMISQLTVSELNDNFLFLHVSGAPGFIFRTDKKTEVITVLENVITEADARELPLVVSNEFKFAHWKYEEMLSVSFQYGDLSHSRAVNNAVIEAHKDRISFKIHHVSSSECKLESIFLDMVDSDSDTPEQRIEVTTSSEVIPISSSVSEYSMFIRFHITETIEGAFVEEKIETASGNQVWVTKLGNLNLEAEQKIRSFDVKIENRKIKSSRLSDTIVSVRLVDEKKRVLFDSRFTYAVQSKRGKRVAALSKLFSRFA